jgi:hypothetical protein
MSISLTRKPWSILQAAFIGGCTFTSHKFGGSRGPERDRFISMHTTKLARGREAYLELNLSLSNILLAAASVRNLLCLRDLGPDSFGAEILNRETLDGVDTQDGVGLNDGEPSGNYVTPSALVQLAAKLWGLSVRKNCLVAPLSSMTSTMPGFSCSIEGTW